MGAVYPDEIVIHDGSKGYADDPIVGGEKKARGLIPRDYEKYPVGYYRGIRPYHAVQMPLIPRSEWPERIKDMVETQSRLSDIRLTGNNGQPIPSLDQNGQGYCWMYSGTSAMMLLRATLNLPYVRLSAHAGACVIKNFRNEGGWGAQGLDRLISHGQPSVEFWPEKSMDRKYDVAATWQNALFHRVVGAWTDLAAAQYNRNLTWDQVITCLLCRKPVIGDFNHWGHSVCLMDPVNGNQEYKVTRSETGKLLTLKEHEVFWGVNDPVTAGIGVRHWNSWADAWGSMGMGILTGSKAVPDGSTAPYTPTISIQGHWAVP